MVRAVRLSLRGVAYRFVVAAIVAALGVVTLLMPLPSWTWPAIRLVIWPVAIVWQLYTGGLELLPPFAPGSLWPGVIAYWLVAVPTYVAVFYLPWVAAATYRTTRCSASRPGLFALYFVAGGLLGSLVGSFLWSSSSIVVSGLSQITSMVVGSIAVGWAAAVIRGAPAWYHVS